MLKTVFSALAVTAILASGTAFAADQVSPATATAVAPSVTAPAQTASAPKVTKASHHVVKHSTAKAAATAPSK